MKFNWKSLLAIILLLAFVSPFLVKCKNDNHTTNQTDNPPVKKEPVKTERKSPGFSADSAYLFIEKQLSFGPRVPNMKSHKACGDWLVSKLKSYGGEVMEQTTTVTAYDRTKLNIRNIIASFNPQAGKRVMLSAHWDSRPWADEDTERQKEPIPAANDAGSGVAVLMEIARQIQAKSPNVGVDIMLWDAEDYGKDTAETYCLGTQYWANNKHKPGYTAAYGINLDMVGAEGALFPREGVSMHFAPDVTDKLWGIANELGYGNFFTYDVTPEITDDHLFVNMIAKIKMIDVIDRRASPNRPGGFDFFPYWHTHKDNIQCISKNTLNAVGHSVSEMIYREQ
ncbi:MAG: M28 family peptidase [Bacteroidia bacterium]|nr:M28 family peptidase [Bacteroidia bacterium]